MINEIMEIINELTFLCLMPFLVYNTGVTVYTNE